MQLQRVKELFENGSRLVSLYDFYCVQLTSDKLILMFVIEIDNKLKFRFLLLSTNVTSLNFGVSFPKE